MSSPFETRHQEDRRQDLLGERNKGQEVFEPPLDPIPIIPTPTTTLLISHETTTGLKEQHQPSLSRTTTIHAYHPQSPSDKPPLQELDHLLHDETFTQLQVQPQYDEMPTSLNVLPLPPSITSIRSLSIMPRQLTGNPIPGRTTTPLATKLIRDPFVAKRRSPIAINFNRTKALVTKRRPLLSPKRLTLFVGRKLTKNPLARRLFKKRLSQGQFPETSNPTPKCKFFSIKKRVEEDGNHQRRSFKLFRRRQTRASNVSQRGKMKLADRRKLPRLLLQSRRNKRRRDEVSQSEASNARKLRARKMLGMSVPNLGLSLSPKTQETTPVDTVSTVPVLRAVDPQSISRERIPVPSVEQPQVEDRPLKIKTNDDTQPKDWERARQIRELPSREQEREEILRKPKERPLREPQPVATQQRERLPREQNRPEHERIPQPQQRVTEDHPLRSREDEQKSSHIPRERTSHSRSLSSQERAQQRKQRERRHSRPSPEQAISNDERLRRLEKEREKGQRTGNGQELKREDRYRELAQAARIQPERERERLSREQQQQLRDRVPRQQRRQGSMEAKERIVPQAPISHVVAPRLQRQVQEQRRAQYLPRELYPSSRQRQGRILQREQEILLPQLEKTRSFPPRRDYQDEQVRRERQTGKNRGVIPSQQYQEQVKRSPERVKEVVERERETRGEGEREVEARGRTRTREPLEPPEPQEQELLGRSGRRLFRGAWG
ncbi:hypothetical protein P280DRAFT_245259 [Massarina eburnea CBS 473.64]|uniref:Uncharacterized protein n=1 Tax=Massarina eburnea CBS 473.64 TaxID=1395130 RepID=A0A6A6S9Q3_9PLEO|nr:hypothetical protein P280DRAFT_245259 [Massarina eburnea CBS 473.64]